MHDFDPDELDDFDDEEMDELTELYYQRYMRRAELVHQAGVVIAVLAVVALACVGIRVSGLLDERGSSASDGPAASCAQRAAREGDGEARLVRMDCGRSRVLSSHPVTPVGTHSWAVPSSAGRGHGTSFVVWNGTAHQVRRGLVDPRYRVLIVRVDDAVPGVAALRELPRPGQPLTADGAPLRYAGLREDKSLSPGTQVLVLVGQPADKQAGTPILDARGRLAGMAYAFTDSPAATLAIPAAALAAVAARSEGS